MNMITVGQYCTRPCGTGCTRCADACPHQAITFDEETGGPVINDEACTRCGICMGICDEFSASTTSQQGLYEHLKKVALGGELVYLTCKENIFPNFKPARNVTVLPCMACMSSELWTLLLAENVPLCLALDLKYCSSCEKAPRLGELLFTRCVEMAETRTGSETRFDRVIPEMTAEEAAEIKRNSMQKRDAFEAVKDDALGIVNGTRHLKNSDTLKDVYRDRERKRMRDMLRLADRKAVDESLGGTKTTRLMPPSHRMLLEAVAANDQCRDTIELLVSENDAELCLSCLKCAEVCPTHARMVEKGKLSLDQRYCIGCGACVAACEKEAIYFVEGSVAEVLPEFVNRIDSMKASK